MFDERPPPPAGAAVAQHGRPGPGLGQERWKAVVLLLAGTLTIMSAATIAPSLPALEAQFTGDGDTALLIRLVLTAPALFIALCAPLAGLIADRRGRRPLLVYSVVLYGLAGMSGLVLDSLPGLLAGAPCWAWRWRAS